MKIVLVEDHEHFRAVLAEALREAGHEVREVECAEALPEFVGDDAEHVFLLDRLLPGENGVSLARRIRASFPRCGIVMLSASAELDARVDGYGAGVDVFLPKPFELPELLAIIDSVAARHAHAPDQPPRIAVDPREMVLRRGVSSRPITRREVRMLSAFAMARDATLERWQVAELLGVDLDAASSSALDVAMARLRSKLREVSGVDAPLRAVRGVGYRLCVAVELH